MIEITVPRVPYTPEPVKPKPEVPQDMGKNGDNKGIIRDERGRVMPGTAPMNPGGRPRGLSITAVLREALEEVEPTSQKTFKELLVRKLIIKAINDGDHATARLIMNYVDGMPLQKLAGDVNVNLTMGHVLQAAAEVRRQLQEKANVIDYAQLNGGTTDDSN